MSVSSVLSGMKLPLIRRSLPAQSLSVQEINIIPGKHERAQHNMKTIAHALISHIDDKTMVILDKLDHMGSPGKKIAKLVRDWIEKRNREKLNIKIKEDAIYIQANKFPDIKGILRKDGLIAPEAGVTGPIQMI